MPEKKDKKGVSLEESIEDLKAFLREEGDLSDETIERETPISVISSFAGKRATEAVEMARKGLAQDPSNVRLKDWLAFNLYAANELEEAIVLYREMLSLNDENAEQHYYLGNCYYKMGDFMAAIHEWKRVIEIAPDSKKGGKAVARIEKVRQHLYQDERKGA